MKVTMKKILFYSALAGLLWASTPMAQEILEAEADSFILGEQTPEEVQENIPEETPVVEITYTWEEFVNGTNCSEQFTQLKEKDFLSEDKQNLISLMGRYCSKEINVWSSLLNTFRQNKKALLLNVASQEKSFINRYLKMAFYSLVDVHKKTPTGDSIYAIMDKIENAIQGKNPEEIGTLISDLPDNQRLFLVPLLNETEQLINFKKTL